MQTTAEGCAQSTQEYQARFLPEQANGHVLGGKAMNNNSCYTLRENSLESHLVVFYKLLSFSIVMITITY